MASVELTLGNKGRTEIVDGATNEKLNTDAPKVYGGFAEKISPTDMMSASLGACKLTMIYAKGAKLGLDTSGIKVSVEKEMEMKPQMRIKKFSVTINMPSGLSPDQRKDLEDAAAACPVAKSVNSEVDVTFNYPD